MPVRSAVCRRTRAGHAGRTDRTLGFCDDRPRDFPRPGVRAAGPGAPPARRGLRRGRRRPPGRAAGAARRPRPAGRRHRAAARAWCSRGCSSPASRGSPARWPSAPPRRSPPTWCWCCPRARRMGGLLAVFGVGFLAAVLQQMVRRPRTDLVASLAGTSLLLGGHRRARHPAAARPDRRRARPRAGRAARGRRRAGRRAPGRPRAAASAAGRRRAAAACSGLVLAVVAGGGRHRSSAATSAARSTRSPRSSTAPSSAGWRR